jgi:hypothetical protein
MTIALSPARKFSGARYTLVGVLSQNADWVQTLELPADGSSVSITGQTVQITFRECEDDSSAVLTVSSTDSQISITDADTLAISVTATVMSALTKSRYVVDLASSVGGVVTHWAHGVVPVETAPVSF